MYGPVHKLSALAVGLCLVLASGCAQTAATTKGWLLYPWKKTPEQALNIKTPDDRLKELQALTKSARGKPAAEQQRLSEELAAEIQHEGDPVMRRQILRTLAAYPTPTARAILAAGTRDSDAEVRVVACHSLAQQAGKESVPELARVVASDTSADVRIAAVKALGQTGDNSASVPLAEAMADVDPALQYRAEESLRAVSGHDFGHDVEAWRQYAKTGRSDTPEVSIAERFLRYFR